MNLPKLSFFPVARVASLESQVNLLRELVRGLSLQINDAPDKRLNEVALRIRYDMADLLADVEKSVRVKLAELDVPRYDWNQTAEGILRRIAVIERQQTLIRDKNFQIEQALLLLGVKLQAQNKEEETDAHHS